MARVRKPSEPRRGEKESGYYYLRGRYGHMDDPDGRLEPSARAKWYADYPSRADLAQYANETQVVQVQDKSKRYYDGPRGRGSSYAFKDPLMVKDSDFCVKFKPDDLEPTEMDDDEAFTYHENRALYHAGLADAADKRRKKANG